MRVKIQILLWLLDSNISVKKKGEKVVQTHSPFLIFELIFIQQQFALLRLFFPL